ncbi:MAG: signal peptidase I [Thiotrichales bacterium]
MYFNLEMILVVASALTGIIWLADKLWLREARAAALVQNEVPAGAKQATVSSKEIKEPWYVEYSRSFFPVLIIVLILRSFIAEPFRIPSGSMIPTLKVGDFILVNKFSYGLRLPVAHTKIVDLGEPERGDVIVFRYPSNPRLDYIKRVIGLPGDHVIARGDKLYINGKPVKKTYLEPYVSDDKYVMRGDTVYQEDLDGVEHKILLNDNNRRQFLQDEFTVPEGHYFVMGDNRDNSNDSRVWGFVPEENLVGKAMLIWMSWNGTRGLPEFSRIGHGIH